MTPENGPAPEQTSIHAVAGADIPAVAAYLARRNSGGASDGDGPTGPPSLAPAERLRWLLLDNPARLGELPLGWVLRAPSPPQVAAAAEQGTGGAEPRILGRQGGQEITGPGDPRQAEATAVPSSPRLPLSLSPLPPLPSSPSPSPRDTIVGAMLCLPLRVAVGDFSTTALMSCKFFVDEPYRGLGLGLFMRFLKLGRRFPLLATTANAASGALFAQFGGYPIETTKHTMLGVRRVGPLAEEWAYRRTGRAALARVLAAPAHVVRRRVGARPSGAGRGELIPLASAGGAVSLGLPATTPDGLSVVRDAAYLRWRYFSADPAGEVFRFRAPRSPDRLVVARLLRAGHRGQVRVLDVVDLWPPATPDVAPLLATALADRYTSRFDAVWLRAQPAVTEAVLRGHGFVPHAFPAPLGWCIDRGGMLPTRAWYLMPGQSE